MGISNNTDILRKVTQFVSLKIEEKRKNNINNVSCFHFPDLDWENFIRLLSAMAEMAMQKRGLYNRFVIDSYNSEVIRQMWLWVIASRDCSLSSSKGIYLGGKIGCGKTILMNAFCDVLEAFSGKVFTRLAAKDIYSYLQANGKKSLLSCPLFIDELGREQVEISDFGNKIRPFVDVMEQRYETGALTMITSNFTIATLSKEKDAKGYGEYINERVQETMNLLVMPGNSRRPLWKYQRKEDNN